MMDGGIRFSDEEGDHIVAVTFSASKPLDVTGYHPMPHDPYTLFLTEEQCDHLRARIAERVKAVYMDVWGGHPTKLARSLGQTHPAATAIMEKPHKMSWYQLRKFCESSGVTLEYLRCETDEEGEGGLPHSAAIADLYERLPFEHRRRLWDLAKTIARDAKVETRHTIYPC